ncbi:dynamin, putative [Perkinsus marinus ATCC 50983]|uniref:Dynamin, putative n=1 Tax=Perkinsus marinus (strain ATCC 50983 / TXsc) TaxID=423536 RepID=C5KRV7_PERM5|nr:dynamin, putative [Perkinsus marinus ATCC 50983]EER12798.1 dynamin, putative [Perkinsus marinus ATCC 50983]|eukprot:XP_002781003.1 dynamin, putative [Perkinsus marinus ATCC 50983]
MTAAAAESTVTPNGLYDNLRRLINVVDELRDVGLQKIINLPRIVVVGTQSSGKSSVLESVVGLDFLPRGDGVVTRRPLELRLVHLSESDHKPDDAWAVFPDRPEKKFTDFDEVRKEIERLTDVAAGANKGIVDDPIVMTIYATAAPDLTLIDLPGITRVPVKGSDQKEDIEKVTKDMTYRYIRDPRTIILAVLAANQDLSTSDALQMARQVDPSGFRTIGVITKIDIMDRGTDAIKMLTGEDIPLRLGYVGVKNRSQADIRENMRVKEALQHEKEWFESHPKYNKLPPGLTGTGCLVQKLTRVLFRHIRNFLPEIKKEITDRRTKVQDRLEQIGSGVPVDEKEQVQLMWTMITDYCDMFKNTIRGRNDRKLQHYLAASAESGEQLASGGSQIRSVFNDFLADFEEEPCTRDLTDEDIERAIRVHEGDALPGFPSPDIFEFLILPYLRQIQGPTMECLNTVAATLEVLSQKMARTVFKRFPKLADQVLELTSQILYREKEHTRAILEDLVAYDTGYLFTNDEEYLESHGSMQPMYQPSPALPNGPTSNMESPPGVAGGPGGPAQGGVAQQQQQEQVPRNVMGQRASHRRGYAGPYVTEIRRRLDAYFSLIIRNVRDSVPRAVGYFLVRQVQDKLQFELYTNVNRAEKLPELLGEPPHIMEERKQLTTQLRILDNAHNVLQRDPTITALQLETMDMLGDESISPPATRRPRSPKTSKQQYSGVYKSTGAPPPPSAGVPPPGNVTSGPPPPAPPPGGSLFGNSTSKVHGGNTGSIPAAHPGQGSSLFGGRNYPGSRRTQPAHNPLFQDD